MKTLIVVAASLTSAVLLVPTVSQGQSSKGAIETIAAAVSPGDLSRA